MLECGMSLRLNPIGPPAGCVTLDRPGYPWGLGLLGCKMGSMSFLEGFLEGLNTEPWDEEGTTAA